MKLNESKKQALNPYLPTYEYIPDGEPRVFDGRLYIFGSHDKAGGNEYCQNDYVCWSADINNLADWRFEGCTYSKNQDPRWTGEAYDNLFAPDVIKGIDCRYYMYYCMAGHDSIAVAVCDEPAGKYEFMGYVHDEFGNEPGAKNGDWIQADPAVLVDDDGSVYVYSGFNPTFTFREEKEYVGAYVMKLKPDMITMVGDRKIILHKKEAGFEGHNFFEASSIRKIKGKYYFVYSSHACHELCYAISDYPDKEFVYQGVLISNVDYGYNGNVQPLNHVGNNHGGLVEINGKYYIFYHRPTNRTMFSRQGSAECLQMDENGHFTQAEMTSCGLNGGPLRGEGEYEAGIVCNIYNTKHSNVDIMDMDSNRKREEKLPYITQEGEDREHNPGTYITNICDSSVLVYKYFDLDDTKHISLFIRGKGKATIYIETETGKLLATVPNQEEYWNNVDTDIEKMSGVHAIRFRYQGEGSIDLFKFILK